MFKVPERFRVRTGPYRSDASYGNNGAFSVRIKSSKRSLIVQASDGAGWEHVSVSINGTLQCPTWDMMCEVKDLFWDSSDLVVQFHPPKENHVSYHPGCLHLWRKFDSNEYIEIPQEALIGPAGSDRQIHKGQRRKR